MGNLPNRLIERYYPDQDKTIFLLLEQHAGKTGVIFTEVLQTRKIELSYTRIPRQCIGYYITRRHYSRHIISISIYLGKGHKVDLTLMESEKTSVKFFNYDK
jgi:hypothetical protein